MCRTAVGAQLLNRCTHYTSNSEEASWVNCYIIIVDEIGLKAKISANHLDFDCDIGLIVRVHVKECDVGVY